MIYKMFQDLKDYPVHPETSCQSCLTLPTESRPATGSTHSHTTASTSAQPDTPAAPLRSPTSSPSPSSPDLPPPQLPCSSKPHQPQAPSRLPHHSRYPLPHRRSSSRPAIVRA